MSEDKFHVLSQEYIDQLKAELQRTRSTLEIKESLVDELNRWRDIGEQLVHQYYEVGQTPASFSQAIRDPMEDAKKILELVRDKDSP